MTRRMCFKVYIYKYNIVCADAVCAKSLCHMRMFCLNVNRVLSVSFDTYILSVGYKNHLT